MFGRLLCGAIAWAIIPATSIDFSLGLFRFHSWRLFIAISAVPSLLGVLLYWFLPESPRYLLEVSLNEFSSLHNNTRNVHPLIDCIAFSFCRIPYKLLTSIWNVAMCIPSSSCCLTSDWQGESCCRRAQDCAQNQPLEGQNGSVPCTCCAKQGLI